jgi:DNA oxidative demethylase
VKRAPPSQLSLGLDVALPGLTYTPDFVTPREEAELLARLSTVPLAEVVMHGQAAKRTVAHFGMGYAYDSRKAIAEAPPIPEWLLPLSARVAPAMHERPDALVEILVTRYPPGARIGWHKDAPAFGPSLAGLSLGAACTLRFRAAKAKPDGSRDTFALDVAPRSLYVIGGVARSGWQHMIPPVDAERWSITFRTLRAEKAR